MGLLVKLLGLYIVGVGGHEEFPAKRATRAGVISPPLFKKCL